MSRELFEIWEEPNSPNPKVTWRAQLVNYVAGFVSQVSAERFVADVRQYREKQGLK